MRRKKSAPRPPLPDTLPLITLQKGPFIAESIKKLSGGPDSLN
jgi:hypothetical protein